MSVRREIDAAKNGRIVLYWFFMGTSFSIILAALYFWAGDVEYGGAGNAWRDADWVNWTLGHIADVLHYILPDLFNNFVDYIVLKQPLALGGLIGVVVVYYVCRGWFKMKSDAACEKARRFILKKMGRTY